MEKQPETPVVPQRKSAVITLHASGSTMTLSAVLKADGSAVTTVTTRDADKNSRRRRFRVGRTIARKKAIITLREGVTIPRFEGI